MLPNMASVLTRWAEPRTVKTVTRQTVDFIESDVVTSRTIKATIQPADKNKLNADAIDWSLKYIAVHSLDTVQNGELIEYQGEDYKIIDNGDYQAFGFTDAVAEQTKRPLVQVTP